MVFGELDAGFDRLAELVAFQVFAGQVVRHGPLCRSVSGFAGDAVLVRLGGVEPPTKSLGRSCSIQLSYSRGREPGDSTDQ